MFWNFKVGQRVMVINPASPLFMQIYSIQVIFKPGEACIVETGESNEYFVYGLFRGDTYDWRCVLSEEIIPI